MENIIEGLKLMAAGMGVVFVFLAILVAAISATAAFFKRFAHLFPEEEAPKTGLERRGEDLSSIAVAIAAVKAYQKA